MRRTLKKWAIRPTERHHATMCHEAGHAVMILLLGRKIKRIEIIGEGRGYVRHESLKRQYTYWLNHAAEKRYIPAELVRLWRDDFFISNAGAIAEEEFKLVSQYNEHNGNELDIAAIESLRPEASPAFLINFFDHQILSHEIEIVDECKRIIRTKKISSRLHTLVELLMRSPVLEGDEVIDLLLANEVNASKQLDLFWEATDASIWEYQKIKYPSVQLALL